MQCIVTRAIGMYW